MNEPIPIRSDFNYYLWPINIRGRYRGRCGADWRLYVGDYKLIEFSKLSFSFGLSLFDESVSFKLFGFYINLPIKPWREPLDMMESWGFSYLVESIHFSWGRKYKIVQLPWSMVHIDSKHMILLQNGSWEMMPSWRAENHRFISNPEDRLSSPKWTAEYPYKYMLHNGEVQNVTATVDVSRRVWRRRWLPAWFPFFQSKCTSIGVNFSEEVGEARGSWKGGCTGCGYEMKPGETPRDTLMRMQDERRFRD